LAGRCPESYAEATLHGAVIRGIVHAPAEPSGRPPVIMLSGWGGTRYGPNGILVEAARALAEDGRAVARFDFRGRGDSDGAVSEHDLACHIEDVPAMAEWVRHEVSDCPPVLLGICSGGEVAVGALFGGMDVESVCLWSAPVFAAESTAARRSRKRLGYVLDYGRKALRPETWSKLVSGQVRFDIVRRVLGGAGVHKKAEDEPTELDGAAVYSGRCGGVLLAYGTADPVAREAVAAYEGLFGRAGCGCTTHWVSGANHGFYGLHWKTEVIRVTREWLAGR